MNNPSENFTPNDMPKRHAKIEGAQTEGRKLEHAKETDRKHPGKMALEAQRNAATKIFRENEDLLEEVAASEKPANDNASGPKEHAEKPDDFVMNEEEVMAKLKREGIDLKQEDMEAVRDNLFLLAKNPEFGKYLQKLSGRLDNIIKKCNKLKEEKNERQAIYDTVDFLANEIDNIEKEIKDEDVRDALISRINHVIDMTKLEQDAKKQVTLDGVSEGIDLIPVVGEAKGLSEAIRGKTMAGEKLGALSRSGKFVWNGGCLVAGVLTGETSELITKPVGEIKAGFSMYKMTKLLAKISYHSHKAAKKINKIKKIKEYKPGDAPETEDSTSKAA